MHSEWLWGGFFVLVFALLALDLCVFHRHAHRPTFRESLGWTIVWVLVALAFNVFVWKWYAYWSSPQHGAKVGLEFLTGYLVEKSLSMDNVFVFAVVFRIFGIRLESQYRVLFFGILGAVVMRLIFVLAGTELIKHFEWIMPVFGAFLLYTGVKLAFHDNTEVEPEKNILLRLARRFFPVSREHQEEHFFVREQGRWCMTPLFLVLLVIESTDVLFAVDSVPAVIGITRDPFIVYSSNIFAILGLRALYFMLAGVMGLFRFLNLGLSAVLVFIGLKMVAAYVAEHYGWIEGDQLIPPWASLIVVVGLIGISIAVSLAVGKKDDAPPL